MLKGKNSIVRDSVKVFFPENLSIGKNTVIDDDVILICKKKLIIGNSVHIAPKTIIRSHEKIVIGNNVQISSFVDIFTATTLPNSYGHFNFKKTKQNSKELMIMNKSFIGSHSVILPGSKICEGTWIGASTVIDFKTSPWSTYLGNPARKVGERKKI